MNTKVLSGKHELAQNRRPAEELRVAVMKLNEYYHEHGPVHKHRVPTQSELPEMRELATRIWTLMASEKPDVQALFSGCCPETTEFVATNKPVRR